MLVCHLSVLKRGVKLSPPLKVDFFGKMLKSKHFGVKNSHCMGDKKIYQNTPLAMRFARHKRFAKKRRV
jgi:hypothetical protein